MKAKSSSTQRAYVPFVVAVAHMIGCTGEATAIGGGDVEVPLGRKYDGLLVGGHEPGAPYYDPGVAAIALYHFSPDGTSVEKIDPGPVRAFKLSPNHARIVLFRGEDTLYFLDPDGRNPASLDVPDLNQYFFAHTVFAISPTGRYVAYGAGDDSNPTVYVARTDGSPGELVFSKGPNVWTWSPVEDKLAVGGGNAPLHIYDAETHSFVEATSPASTLVTDTGNLPWTLDGERLAFVEKRPFDTVLTTVDKRGQDRRVLLTNVESAMASGSGWSPDGKYFALMQENGNSEYLRLVDAMGTMSRDITNAITSGVLGWSPTSDFVYFQQDWSIASARLSGPILQLTEPYTGCPQLGPNGRLVHVGSADPVRTINADGSNPISHSQIPYGTCYATQLSDDGKVIAFGPFGGSSLYVGASDADNATLVLQAMSATTDMHLRPIAGSGGIVFDEGERTGWILPTKNGFQAIYPQLVLDDIHWAYALDSSF